MSGARRRRIAYDDWSRLTALRGAAGALFWMLAGPVAGGEPYPDYDGFTVYPEDAITRLLAGHAARAGSDASACALARGIDEPKPSPFVRARAVARSSRAAGQL